MNLKHRLALGALAAGLAAGAHAADYTMRLSHQFPPAHHSAKNMEQFCLPNPDKIVAAYRKM